MKKWLIFCLLSSFPIFGETQTQPEFSSGYTPKKAVYAKNMMVASANPLATKAGVEILQKGGNALDAAIAMQMVLTVVEPQSSGLGGGAFLLYYQKDQQKVYAYDGRETAPSKVDEAWFLDKNNEPIPFEKALIGGKSVGVPGLLKMLEMAHQQRGKLRWNELFTPAIDLANHGFPISSRLHQLIKKTKNLNTFPETSAYLFRNGKPKKEGERLQNLELAETLVAIAQFGAHVFYQGPIAQKIVSAVQKAGGVLSEKDLAEYKPLRRKPVKFSYKNYTLYGFPPPSAGGVVLGQMFQLLSSQDFEKETLGSVNFINLFCHASRLAFADRDYYIADPEYFPVPFLRLLDQEYMQIRRQELKQNTHQKGEAIPGAYPGQSLACCPPLYIAKSLECPSTSQICVVDEAGNGVSMTTSVENAFGSTLMAAGFFLNNQLTDFSLIPEKNGNKAANRIEPGKRPMSSMAPTLVFKEGSDELYLTIGSAGGARIIDYVAKAIFGVLDFDMNIQEAIDFPNFTSIKEFIDLEQDTSLVKIAPALRKLGNQIRVMPLTSGTQGIQRKNEALVGGVDPRREGLALGGLD